MNSIWRAWYLALGEEAIALLSVDTQPERGVIDKLCETGLFDQVQRLEFDVT